MANKKLIVEVIADSSRFRSGLSESEKAANQFEGKIKGSASAVRSRRCAAGPPLAR